MMVGAARKNAMLLDFLAPLEKMREYYAPDDFISLCPGCWCLTGDVYRQHSHSGA